MKIQLEERQLKCKEEFRQFTDDEIMPYADTIDRQEYIPDKIFQKLSEKGYLGFVIPEKYGGSQADNITIGLLNEEIGRGCFSVRSLLTVHGMVAIAISRWGTEEQKQKWLSKLATGEVIGAFGLTEPNIGSDAKNIETTAVKEGENYIINGSKKWITMGAKADVFVIFAQYEGKPTAFLVEKDTPGFVTTPIKGLLGARGSMSVEISMKNLKVSEGNLLGKEGAGLTHVALTCLDYGRFTVAWGCVGAGQACLESSVRYSRKRKQFGSAIRQNQLIQKMISEMTVNIKAARLLCYSAAYLRDEGDPDSIMETWYAKYFASTKLVKIASDAVQIHGANGCSRDYPVERLYRDAKINEVIEGTSQMHEVLIANNTFRYC